MFFIISENTLKIERFVIFIMAAGSYPASTLGTIVRGDESQGEFRPSPLTLKGEEFGAVSSLEKTLLTIFANQDI